MLVSGSTAAGTEVETEQKPKLGKSDIRAYLKILVRDGATSQEAAKEALSGLKKVARSYGVYLTASEIHSTLSNWPPHDENGTLLDKDRAYGFAAELFIHQIYHEINSMETDGRILGPSVFEGYLVELIDCLFCRQNSRKGVEAALALWETLLTKTVTGIQEKQVYLALAERAIGKTLDMATEKSERDAQTHLKTVRINKREGTPLPQRRATVTYIDVEVIGYLRDAKRRFAQLQSTIAKIDKSNGKPIENSQQMVAYLNTLVTQVGGVESHTFTGITRERLGLLQEGIERGSGQSSFKTAANYFELQADRDTNVQMRTLAQQRYKHAGKLYVMAGAAEDAQRVKQKLDESSVPQEQADVAQG